MNLSTLSGEALWKALQAKATGPGAKELQARADARPGAKAATVPWVPKAIILERQIKVCQECGAEAQAPSAKPFLLFTRLGATRYRAISNIRGSLDKFPRCIEEVRTKIICCEACFLHRFDDILDYRRALAGDKEPRS